VAAAGIGTRTTNIRIVVHGIRVDLFVPDGLEALSSATIDKSFTQPRPDEYVSAGVVLNTSGGLAVSSPAALWKGKLGEKQA
jgi:hypothetical protein